MTEKKKKNEAYLEYVRRLLKEAHKITNGLPKPKKKDKDNDG